MTKEYGKARTGKGMLAAAVLIIAGVTLLLERNGVIDRHTVSQWSPLLLVFAGTWLAAARLKRSRS